MPDTAEKPSRHLWMRFGGPTRCGKCGAFMGPKTERTVCPVSETGAERVLRYATSRAHPAVAKG